MTKPSPKKPLVVAIVGPTASGKTAFSIALAKKIGGEIVSVDSRQVYTGLNLGTGKVTKHEMAGVPHHLLDVSSPKRIFTVSDYVPKARRAIDDICSRGRVPILCGGTGLYLDAVLGRVSIPEVPPNLALRARLGNKTPAQLFIMLKSMDPRRARTIEKHNPVRLIRAIEIAQALGTVPPLQPIHNLYTVVTIGMMVDKKTLEKNIHDRLLARMKAGMLREVKALHAKGLSWRRMEGLGLEYRYCAYYVQGKLTKQEMLEKLEQEIRKYAKRQRQWFKRNKNTLWVKPIERARAYAHIRTSLTTSSKKGSRLDLSTARSAR